MPGRVRELAEEQGATPNRDDGIPYDGVAGIPEGTEQGQAYKERNRPTATPKPSNGAVPFKNLR